MLSLFHGFLSDEILIKSINKRIVRTAASKALGWRVIHGCQYKILGNIGQILLKCSSLSNSTESTSSLKFCYASIKKKGQSSG